MSLLAVANVSKSFGGVVANENISLNVAEGKIIGLIGPNGSGKTTLFNSIVGFHPVDSGSVKFDGAEISNYRVPQIARLGLLRTFQQTHIYGEMDCIKNMQISISQSTENFSTLFRKMPGRSHGKSGITAGICWSLFKTKVTRR